VVVGVRGWAGTDVGVGWKCVVGIMFQVYSVKILSYHGGVNNVEEEGL
jgi:hypothetical protein